MKKIIGYFLFIFYSPFLNAVLYVMFLFGKDRYVRANAQFLLDLKGEGFTDEELSDAGFMMTGGGEWAFKHRNGWIITKTGDRWVASDPSGFKGAFSPRNIEEIRLFMRVL